MFENKKTTKGIYYSRYIASWLRIGGRIPGRGKRFQNVQLFTRWLSEVEGLNEKEIADILFLAENGKMELEDSAKKFLEEHKDEWIREKEMNLYTNRRI